MEAFDYAKLICERSTKSDYVYTMTALMVKWNTIAKHYEPSMYRKTQTKYEHYKII